MEIRVGRGRKVLVDVSARSFVLSKEWPLVFSLLAGQVLLRYRERPVEVKIVTICAESQPLLYAVEAVITYMSSCLFCVEVDK